MTVERKTVLIVDDEARLRRVVADYLRLKGYTVKEADNGVAALTLVEQEPPDLVLLDVMMPVMDGFETCRRLREKSTVPVVMLTARSEEADELAGFSLGVDEYVTKPFSLKVLEARLEAILRRQTEPAGAAGPGLVIDQRRREVWVDGTAVPLTYTEFELLSYLVTNTGLALSRDQILDGVWRYDYDGDARTVDTHVKKLRSKLGVYGDRIRTVRGIGYKYDSREVAL